MISQEIDKLLEKRHDFIGKIYPYYKNNTPYQEIANHVGHKNTASVSIFITTLDYLYGIKDINPKMYKSIEQLEYRIKEWNIEQEKHSPELQKYFQELSQKIKLLHKSEKHTIDNNYIIKEPGVYVYTYPQYLLSEAFDQDNRTLFKIGATGNLDSRIERQARQTEVPEDLITIRKFPTTNPFDKEENFHSILTAVGHHHKTTSGGVEWFRTSLQAIDAIAQSLKLTNVEEKEIQ